jgi:formylglycine-generating enzyme required for sulfatase activity
MKFSMSSHQTNQVAKLIAEIANLEQRIALFEDDRETQMMLCEQLVRKQQTLAALRGLSESTTVISASATNYQTTSDKVQGDKVQGDKVQGDKVDIDVGLNLGTIIYGHRPEDDELRRLVWYLDRLATKLHRLPLRGIEDQLERGKGVALPQVYVTLASLDDEIVEEGSSDSEEIGKFFSFEGSPHLLKDLISAYSRSSYSKKYDPNTAARMLFEGLDRNYSEDWVSPPKAISAISAEQGKNKLELYRQLLLTELVNKHKRIVILGSPGSGKSTFVRHLAWSLAMRGLDQPADLFGWDHNHVLLPIVVPLRVLAGHLAKNSVSDKEVTEALKNSLIEYDVNKIDDLLRGSLHRGSAIILFDGLDEVPLEATSEVVDRRTTLSAIHEFAKLYAKPLMIITCRTHAYTSNFRSLIGWPVAEIAPFTLGQTRRFVSAWYGELQVMGQIDAAHKQNLERTLLDTIVTSKKLRDMAATPLLLTLMALVLYNKGELPRDRPQLYERVLELLLGQWDKVREGQSISEAIDQPNWNAKRILPVLDKLSFEAHANVTSEDGRGRLTRSTVRSALIDFFETARVPDPWKIAQRCLDYFEQRSGLISLDDNDSYVFAHLTLQEHCAGRYLLFIRNARELVMKYRVDDRWREPIFLGLGVVQQAKPELLEGVLGDLIDRDEQGVKKPVSRWYRDLILAAEIGQDRDWNYLRTQQVNVNRLQRDLRNGLVALLDDASQPLSFAERRQGGVLLGSIDDPRFPVTIDQWKEEVTKALEGQLEGYFCRVDAGEYIIGSNDDDSDEEDEKPQHIIVIKNSLLIARFPITNDQWRVYIPVEKAHDDSLHHNPSNAPVVGINLSGCEHFCSWLSQQLVDVVPINYELRLPTEFEWEAAARGSDARQYTWGNQWLPDHAASQESQGLETSATPAPVGCFAAGAAPCGALDILGNVWEWTSSVWHPYPNNQDLVIKKDMQTVRGGCYTDPKERIRCAARGAYLPTNAGIVGFRIVLAPRPEYGSGSHGNGGVSG